jgi:cell division protein FtsQ
MPAVRKTAKKNSKKTKSRSAGHAARQTPAKRRTANRLKSRGRKVDFRTRWRRRMTDWRVRFDESKRLLQGAVLSLLTVGVYVCWATGVFVWMGDKISEQLERGLVVAGFSIEQVQVEGRNKTGLESVREALAIDQGESILHYSTRDARVRLEALDWIEEAQVIRFLPDTIHVVLVERSAVAIWQMNRELYLIDRTGFVVGAADESAFGRLPLVVGKGAAESAAQLFEQLALVPEFGDQVAASIRVGERRWTLRLKNGIDVNLPADGVESALKQLIEYDSQYDLLSQEIVSIDMRLTNRMYLKLSDDKAAKLWSPGTET